MNSTHPRTGQFGVVRTKGFMPAMIRLFTRSQVNHAYVYINETTIVEAESTGAVHSRASKYANHVKAESNFWLVPGEGSDLARAAERLVGRPYGFLDIVCIALATFGLRYRWLLKRVEREDRLICSQLVDRVYHNAGVDLYRDGRPDGMVTPGDLLMYLAQGNLPYAETEDTKGLDD